MAIKNKTPKPNRRDTNAFPSSTRIIRVFAGGSKLRIYVFVGLFLLVNLLLPAGKGGELFDIPKEGDITKKAVIAPFTFDILKTRDEIDKEQKEAVQKVLPVVEYNYDVTEKMIAKFRHFFKQMVQLRSEAITDAEKSRVWADLKKDLSSGTLDAFLSSDINYDNLLYIIDDILNQGICSAYFVRDEKNVADFKSRYNVDYVNYQLANDGFVTYIRDDKEKTVAIRDLLTKEEMIEQQKVRLRKQVNKNIMGPLFELLYAYLSPNVFYLEDETQKRRDAAAKIILPTRGKVVKDLEIVGKNKLVTPEIYRNLYSLKMAQERMLDVKRKRDWYPLLGRLLLVGAILILFFAVMDRLHQRPFFAFKNLLAISLILVGQIALLSMTYRLIYGLLIPMEWGGDMEWGFLLPFILGPLLVTVLYDMESGALFCLTSLLILSLILGLEFKVTLIHGFAGLTAIRAVNNIRYRSHFFIALLLSWFTYMLLIAAVMLFSYGDFDWGIWLKNSGVAGLSAFFCLMIAILLIWIFERVFGLTTNLTLIELSDMNSPALKQLSIEAPGTYHHSVLVGNLAESAAEVVGANPLKTRVLAYYHDIGKIFKPEYFIENQVGVVDSLHEKISPRMSAIIISSHVKQGLDLARKYKLPPVVSDAIREHHGTTLISFFYERARELEPEKNLLRDDFCYPGPKPRSKETALIMLADSVEAASRTLTEPTASRLKGLVHSIIDNKIADGQLDDCDLTFIDLAEIKKNFVPVLTAMFHARIEYPDAEARRTAKAEVKRTIKISLTE